MIAPETEIFQGMFKTNFKLSKFFGKTGIIYIFFIEITNSIRGFIIFP